MTKLTPNNWTAVHTHDNCVQITLGEDIPLDQCKLRIVSAERQEVEEENLTTHTFEVCLHTELPLYVELTMKGCVPETKYIEKTGDEYYSKLTAKVI